MKKLIAILFSVLMLCALIPFAAVSASAEGDHYIELVADAEEVNAGDEITIEVYLYGHESLGLIGAQIDLAFDPDVFELETYYDEDEEMWMAPIEVGPKFSASSNKYILFPEIDEETGELDYCMIQFLRATASASQAVKTNLFYTVTFKVKDDAVSGDYTIDVTKFNNKNIIGHGNTVWEWTWEPVTIHVNGSEPEAPSCEHEYNYDCDKVCSKCGEETRPEAEHQYFYACDAHCMICGELTNESAAHTLNHVEAVPATCTVNGNIEYWTCSDCGGAWDNENATGMPLNRYMVIVSAPGHTYFDDCSAICDVCGEEREVSHNIIHVEAKAADCSTDGNIEYWYCDVCGMAWLDAECTLNTNLMSVTLPASCSYNAIHNEGVAAGCHYTGRLESWYCANCDVYYLDAACAQITNYKSLTIPALQDTADHVAAKAPTCDEPGNVEYWICNECEQVWTDAALTQLSNYKNVQLAPAHNVIHVEAKAANCYEPGNIEYWYCDVCGAAWTDELCIYNTNLKAVVLGATCSTNAVYTEAKAATCFEPGNVEYWYCANCDVYYLDAACTIITNAKSVILPIAHNIIAVEAKAATCTEMGNIAYWYCADCGQAWLDELCIYNTNLKAVVLPMADHTYDAANDADCNVCGATREIAAKDIIVYGGKSVSEVRNGLAFRFDAAVSGIDIGEDYVADYTNAIVTIGGVEYKLVGMGAIANNKGYSAQTLADVDGISVLDIPAKKCFDGSSYAIRIINIPEAHRDTEITVCSYFQYECGGEIITVYGEDIVASYNQIAG